MSRSAREWAITGRDVLCYQIVFPVFLLSGFPKSRLVGERTAGSACRELFDVKGGPSFLIHDL